jgi:branched-chain amino acid transport system ATP-binding protein
MTSFAPMQPLLVAEHISKRFGGLQALSDISVTVGVGESVGIVGPNGAGKTTFFNCVCGQVTPDSGTLTFAGHDLTKLPVYRRARLGIRRTFQRIEVFPELTVRDHILVAERARRGDGALWKDLLNMGKPKAEEVDRVNAIMGLVALSALADVPVASLSLGHCRLVELGRALAGDPQLLLADEPSSGLDKYETAMLSEVLRQVQRDSNTALLLVEHDLQMVGRVSDRVVVLNFGQYITSGTFDQVIANPEVRVAYLGRTA